MRNWARAVALAAVAFGGALLFGPSGWAAEPIEIGGRLTCKTPEMHSIPVAGDPNHVLVVLKETCIGSATGQSARFDGGEVTETEHDDFVKGSGTIRGYEQAKYKDGSTATDIYVGEQLLTAMVDGKPVWVAQGTWEQMHGTGSLANAQLRGTWTAKPISDSEYAIDWVGTLTEGVQQ
jgi:hypothetical protein